MHSVSRRSVVTALAAVPVAAIPAAALATLPEPDPVFAAIERHRVAYAELQTFPACDAPVGSAEMRARDEEFADACGDVDAVAWAILDAEPITIAGVAALLAYLNDHSQGGYAEFPSRDEGSITFEEVAVALAVKVLGRFSKART